MQTSTLRSRAGLALAFAFFLFSAPGITSAATAVDVHQILPPQGESCPVLGATDVTPYVYDGKLNSFDVSINDQSYVAIAATVGETPISFQYITRWYDQGAGVRLHVDLAPYRLAQDTPITVTLISAHAGGSPVTCVATLSTVLPAVAPTPAHPASGPTGNTGYPWSDIGYGSGSAPQGQGSTTASSAPVLVTATHSLGGTCGANNGPARLWVILLVLYAIFVWVLASQKEEVWKGGRDWSVGLTVVGFIALLFFWYISASCRTGAWAPVLATLIACAGLIALTRSGTTGGSILLLKDGKR